MKRNGKLIATDLPTISRHHLPPPSTLKNETILANLKEKLINVARRYRSEFCNAKGFPKSNLTQQERSGIKELKDKINKKECVVFKSDKSSRLTVDSTDNYIEAIGKHTQTDIVIDQKTVKQIENRLNDNLRTLNSIFEVGSSTDRKNNQDRVRLASISTNVPAPPLDGYRKDHKPVPEGQEDVGPPVRPVCAANVAPNSSISHFLIKIINDYSDAVDSLYECGSLEEMRASFQAYNSTTDPDSKKRCKILSMDVSALFPSMSRQGCMIAVKEMILDSTLEMRHFDWWPAAKYIHVMYDSDTIDNEGLSNVIPKRLKVTRRKLTVNCLQAKNDDAWWIGEEPTEWQKKRMLALVVAAAVNETMSNHCYKVGDTTFLQSEGGPIGLELTGALSRPFMRRWDRLFLEAVEAAGIKMKLYERYVDDSNQIAECKNEDDDDKTVAKELTEIANQIIDGIKMACDLPSNHTNMKLPILDMEVWLDEEGNVLHNHYEKKVSSKLVISQRSAHSNASKRSVHIQELTRRMYGTSRELDWDENVAPVLSEYCGRMMAGGYSEKYRKNIVKHALVIYDDKIRKNDAGEVPLNRPKGYKKIQRRKEKRRKKRNWSSKGGYVAPIIIQSTPDARLLKMMKQVAETEPELKFNIIEKGGITVEKMLARPNPTASDGCAIPECEGCKQEGGMKKCQKCNHMYSYTCMEPGCMFKLGKVIIIL